MLTAHPLAMEHFDRLTVQFAQRGHFALFTPDVRAELVDVGSVAAVTEAGDVAGIGGIIPLGFGRGEAWTCLATGHTHRFAALHKIVARHLAASKFRRIQMAVDPRCEAALRWAALLGFGLEGMMAGYFENGAAALLYARVR